MQYMKNAPQLGQRIPSDRLSVPKSPNGYQLDILHTSGCLAKDMTVSREDLPNGSFILRNNTPLGDYAENIPQWLLRWAEDSPDVTFLAERDATDRQYWRTYTYAETLSAVRSLAQAILDLELEPTRPLVILSGNSVSNALITLACFMIGVPVTTVSVAYSLKTSTHERIHEILTRLNPGLIFAEDGELFGKIVESSSVKVPAIFARNSQGIGLDFSDLLMTHATDAVRTAHQRVEPDTVARLLLTSGSTGKPKLVENTHRMLCANQTMIAQCWPFVHESQPIVLDWLPWSHTFGANHNFNIVLRNGGSLFIDDGMPVPGLIERSLENIKLIKPTLYFNVPRGFDMLLGLLENDSEATQALFSRLQILFYAAAALPESTWNRLEALADGVRQEPLFFTSEWGATETSPVITNVNFKLNGPGNLGIPVPGMELKMVPASGKYEMRVKGVSVFSTYRNAPELTKKAFDEDGFYCIEDAGRMVNPDDPTEGIIFDGRVSEDFKLSTGTWVWVGSLRVKAVSNLAPFAQDVVITGHNHDEVGLLIFPTPDLFTLAGEPPEQADWTELGRNPAVRAKVRTALESLAGGAGSSQCASRALILPSPPSIDDGEITDKGYINQAQVLKQRQHLVEELYATSGRVITRSEKS